jgi:hypothetical protein
MGIQGDIEIMDILATIRANLIADTDITDLVSVNDIRVENNPIPTTDKQILLRETLGRSEIKLDAELGVFTILIYVKDSIDEPVKIIKEISVAVLKCLNKKNETLKDEDTFVRFFVKSSGELVHDNDNRCWMKVIVFDFVTGE